MDARKRAQAAERLEAAVRRVGAAEQGLAKARADVRAAMIAAREAEMSLTEIGNLAGVSRQRVKQLIEREP